MLHPYDFLKQDDANYYFETDNGLKYHAYFIEMPSISSLYSFSFEKESGDSYHDTRVRDTIISIMTDFFQSDYPILGYTCDTSDGKHKARQRLFRMWYNKFNDGSLSKYDFEEGDVYISIIVSKDYFAADNIVSDVVQLIQETMFEK